MKTILLFSGGLDSTVLLHQMLDQKHTVKALTFSYGQPHVREIEHAERICRALGVDHSILDLPGIGKSGDVFHNRNMIFLSVAISMAIGTGYDSVAYCPTKDDYDSFPDCRPEFVLMLERASMLAGNFVKILSPYINIDKWQVVKKGLRDYKIDLEQTWTCYAGGVEPCGKCKACITRSSAIETELCDYRK